MKNFKIKISDSATYTITAENQEEAVDKAIEWFQERSPKTVIEITEEGADYTIIKF